jgi:hypothetical protein
MLLRFVATAALALLGACSSIHPPELQVEDHRASDAWTGGPLAPRQTAWRLDGVRRFDGEFKHDWWGPIRFVDLVKGIDSFVGFGQPPDVTVDSDDPDVIFAIFTFGHRPTYSTDGGRSFYQDAREFPSSSRLRFLAVRNGHVYAGLQIYSREDGYVDWDGGAKLFVLEATLDKARARIGRYRLIAPRGHVFDNEIPAYARGDVRSVDSLGSLRLPKQERAPWPKVREVLHVPPNEFHLADGPVEFLAWFDATARANPDWVTVEKKAFADHVYKHYRRSHNLPDRPGSGVSDVPSAGTSR